MESSSGGDMGGKGPVLPIFIQMNARLVEEDDQWKEATRWVKFQENVEDGGKRWSKPHVPSTSFAVMTGLRDLLDSNPVLLDCKADNINSIMDDVLGTEQYSDLETGQVDRIRQLFSQGVKQKMKISIVRQMSKTSVHAWQGGKHEGQPDSPTIQEEGDDNRLNKSAPTTPETRRRLDEEDEYKPLKRRHFSVTSQSGNHGRSERKLSYKDETLKYRDYNLFSKKVPKDAEAANIQVATCDFLDRTIFAFVRLRTPVLLEDFSEINKPTRFLGVILGPRGSGAHYMEMGRALGTLLSDQLFCEQSAYKANTTDQLLKGLDMYMQELTVLPPSSWDPNIRLDPPKSTPSVQARLVQRANLRQRHLTMDEEEEPDPDEEFKISLKEEKVNHREDDGLQFTGRLFGGLIDDVKRKLPWFGSDFTDALHIQTVASIIYIYLATVTKAITFGGFLGDVTEGLQGVLESFLGHCLAGGVFCLLGGQPLTVLGCTGPVLIFEKILIGFCSSNGISYMTMRLWIGLWSALFCIIIVAVDGSAIVRYFTRFTEEAFAALVGIIFIVEALKKIFKVGKQFKVHKGLDIDYITQERCTCSKPDTDQVFGYDNKSNKFIKSLNGSTEIEEGNFTISTAGIDWESLPVSHCKMLSGDMDESCKYVPDIFFFSVILFFGTFLLCSTLKKFKLSPFFPSQVRKMVSDYAVILTIIVFVLIDMYFDLDTQKLLVPTVFKPTRSDLRGWIVPFFDDKSPWYVYLLAAIPALLLTILLFMDQQITSVIVNRKEHKLKKGAGYHLDMLIVGVMMGVCSVLGLPWCVAATVLCLGHVDSLKMDTESSAPGETPQFLGVREQRVTGVMVFVLTGLSVKLAPILKFIPMPVLYGVLMYMGVNTLTGMQFVDRIFLMLMPSKHQPDYPYLRHVPLRKVHLFTGIQAAALAALWIIKSTQASLIFPLMVLALVGFRKVMDFFPSIFSQKDLFWLDNLMPQKEKKKKKKKKDKKGKKEVKIMENGTEEELELLKKNGEA